MGHYIFPILTVVGLFLLGVLSPGPNFVAVVQASLYRERLAGVATGLGVALGDAIYAAVGLFGLAAAITQSGWIFSLIKTAGGLYLAWIGLKMVLGRGKPGIAERESAVNSNQLGKCFRIGLFTGLANPKTVVFFASIFAFAFDPASPNWVAGAMLGGIVVTSVLWRIGLSFVFSTKPLRMIYQRIGVWVERLFGSFLIAAGLGLAAAEPSR